MNTEHHPHAFMSYGSLHFSIDCHSICGEQRKSNEKTRRVEIKKDEREGERETVSSCYEMYDAKAL